VATRLAGSDYVDVQISLDGATAEVNDAVRGPGSYATALRAMGNLADAGFVGFKLSVVCTRQNIGQLDEFKTIADRYGAQLRLTRLRPSGRGADVWNELHPTADQQRELYDWLVLHGDRVLTGDSFFHLAAYGDSLPGLNLCGAGRVVCLIDPVGDVYACPFAIHENFLAGNVTEPGGFAGVWRESDLFAELRGPQTSGACTKCQHFDSCRGGCMAAKFFTGLPLDGPDPECVMGYGVDALLARGDQAAPKPSLDHSHRVEKARVARPVPIVIGARPDPNAPVTPPVSACQENPLAGFVFP
jgi:mycofactocin radical SAM maturase